MDLFSLTDTINILPYDGIANYHGKIYTAKEARFYLETLMHTIPWQQDELIIFGKRIITKRKVAWYGDIPFAYTYSHTTKQALLWTEELIELKKILESTTGDTYNSCLLNLYHNGSEGMAWHSDDEKSIVQNSAIASLSLGAERKFSFKHKKTKQTCSILLENGSLLNMQGTTQQNWLHSLPKTTKVDKPRINLTFRTMIG
jgi:alkylated DNA repair dioxygenase AlkB